ncbi:threonine-phosphate decarboxylase CobD [Clostridium sp. C2-6-12]|uniref:threonine-phosphate decarboxylase CobD n=1 Tax=Clostridium sp. C2-6-12 TaxID=2698832 RepID=UPI00136B4EEE|nr:threonine-phosphate decarboxylase CobD [Clostridium sp. C2-6-12]
MASLGHGGNAKEISRSNNMDYDKIIDFSANINPLGMPESVKKAIVENLSEAEKYPDITYYELKSAISEFEDVTSNNIILGNGAAEVLFNVVRGINPRKSLVLAPTFSEYEEAVKAINGDIIYYYLNEESQFHIKEDILNYIKEDLNLLFICNPNNPTGVITKRELLIKVLKKAEEYNVFVVIDESFLDFINEDLSMIMYISEFQNLIVIKSLTKFFALPGIRIGYGISGNIQLMKKVESISPAWNINIFAEIATKAGLKDENYIRNSIKYISDEKDYLYRELSKINELRVYEPSVNFILLKTLTKINLKEELLKYDILIRSCSNYNGFTNNYYRVAVRSHEENSILIKSLVDIFEQNHNKE